MKVQFEISFGDKRVPRVVWRVILAMALCVPVVASAAYVGTSDLPFIDIPPAGPVHDAVSDIYNAGITGGTTLETFSPIDPVQRQQMALFLQRGLPRAVPSQSVTRNAGAYDQVAQTIEIDTPGLTGKSGFVLVTADFRTDNGGDMYSDVFYWIEHEGTQVDWNEKRIIREYKGSGSITRIFPVSTGQRQKFKLWLYPAISIHSSMSAVYIPLSGVPQAQQAPDSGGQQ